MAEGREGLKWLSACEAAEREVHSALVMPVGVKGSGRETSNIDREGVRKRRTNLNRNTLLS